MQFLPSEWAQYGVDANGDGFEDPYNPADAIFAAARYLRAAGGDTDIKAAVYSYNHSQAYVESVMLRAQLLGGTPSELLGAITGLTEARFPVHAASHYSDGFPTVSAGGSAPPTTLVGTTIYSQAGAPVIAVQDGEIVQIGDSPSLGRFVSLRDAYGNTYVYAAARRSGIGVPGARAARPQRASARGSPGRAGADSRPNRRRAVRRRRARSRARRCPRAPPSRGLRSAPPPASNRLRRSTRHRRRRRRRLRRASRPRGVRVFTEGPNDVYLHPAAPGRAGDRGDGPRPRRRRRRNDAAAHPLPDPPGRGGRAADRPQADPRRLGGARGHLDLQGQGREPVPGDLADGRPGAARVKAAARAAGAARRRHPSRRVRTPGRAGGQGRQARAGDARVPVRLGPETDRLRTAVRGLDAGGARGQRSRERQQRGRGASPPSTASRSPATRGRARSRTPPCASC